MIKCISGKKAFQTQESAEDALIEARIRYAGAGPGGPVTVYKCEDCGQFHLTSKGTANPRLRKFIAEGKLKLNQEGNRWLDKLKK